MKIYGDQHLPQLLFIHGGGVGPWMWDQVIQELTTHFQCIVVTLPYHGQEVSKQEGQFNESTFTIESYSHYLIDQVKGVRNDKAIGVVGFSLGAQIALELLSLSPHLFKFAMINSGLCTSTGIPSTLIKPMITMTAPLAKLKSFAQLQASTLYIPASLFQSYFTLSKSITTTQLTEIMRTNMNYRLKPSFDLTTADVHITYGAKENVAIKNSARTISERLPQATTYVVPKLGHGFPLAEPVLFANYIKQHFTTQSPH